MRANRVKSLKKIIIISLLTAIMIPIILCIVILVRLNDLENKVQELYTMRESESIINKQNLSETIPEADVETGILDENVEMDKKETENEKIVRKIHLTFDDGPSNYTEEILDILAEYNVKATFFVVGKEDAHSLDMYKKIVEEGHTIGMHSYSHKYNEIYASKENYIEDLEKLQNLLYDVTGVKPMICRFPGGSSNTVSKVPIQELVDYLEEKNIKFHDWNVSSGDATSDYISADKIVENCTGNLEGYREATILFHDANDKRTTVEALPIVIAKLLEMEDTVISPLTEDIVPIQHIRD